MTKSNAAIKNQGMTFKWYSTKFGLPETGMNHLWAAKVKDAAGKKKPWWEFYIARIDDETGELVDQFGESSLPWEDPTDYEAWAPFADPEKLSR